MKQLSQDSTNSIACFISFWSSLFWKSQNKIGASWLWQFVIANFINKGDTDAQFS